MITIGDLLAILRLRDEMSPAMANASETVKTFGNTSNASAYQLTLLGRGLREAGALATGVFTVPIAGAAAAVVHFGGDFEEVMSRTVSLAGVTQQQLAGVKQHILDLAPTVGIGPVELAKAMYAVSSTVEDTNVAMQILDRSARLSAAGMGDSEVVARALTTVINSYGSNNITAARAADVLTRAIRDGGAEATALAPVLANVVPFAAKMGVSIEQVAANFVVLTKNGVPASEAITQLTSVFAALSRETPKGEAALKGVGLSYAKLKEEIRDPQKGLEFVLLQLKDAFAGNDKGLFSVLGRLEALKDIMSVTGAQAATYSKEVVRMGQAQGEADQAFETATKNFNFMWKQIVVSLQAVAIQVSQELLPMMKSSLEFIRDHFIPVVKSIATTFGDLPQFVQIGILGVLGFLAILGPGLIVIGQFIMAIGNISRAFALFSAGESASGISALRVFLTGGFWLSAATAIGAISIAIAAVWAAWKIGNTDTVKNIVESWALTSNDATAQLYRMLFGLQQTTPEILKMVQGSREAYAAQVKHNEATAQTIEHLKTIIQPMAAHTSTLVANTSATGVNSAANQTLLEKVKSLTAEQKLAIQTFQAQGMTTTQIAKETGIAAEVVGVYERQVKSATKAVKEHDDQLKNGEKTAEMWAKVHADMMKKVQDMVTDDTKKRAEDNAKDHAFWMARINAQFLAGQKGIVDLSSQVIKSYDDLEVDSLGKRIRLVQNEMAEKRRLVTGNTEERATQITMIAQLEENKIKETVEVWNKSFDAKEGKNWTKQLEVVSRAFKEFSSSVTGDTKIVFDSISDITRILHEVSKLKNIDGTEAKGGILGPLFDKDASDSAKWASAITSGLTIVGGAINVWKDTADAATKTQGAFLGAMSGAKAGAAFGPWGIAIGAAGGALIGFIHSLTAGRRAIEDFAASKGGFEALHQEMLVLGDAGEKMWIQLTQQTSKGDKAGAMAQITAITKALEAQKIEAEALTADLSKYNLTQYDVVKGAQSLYTSYTRLVNSGIETSQVTHAMKDDLNKWLGAALDAGKKIPPGMQPIIEQLITMGDLTEDNAAKMLGLSQTKLDGGSFDDVMAAAGRYGITLDELGPKVNQLNIDQVAAQISKDWKLLTSDGEDINVVMSKMKGKVQEVVSAALKFGDTIPESMKPVIDKMIEAGLLTDEFGNKLLDDHKLTFAKPLSEKFDELIVKLGELVDAIIGPKGVGGALDNLGNRVVHPRIQPIIDTSGIPDPFDPNGDPIPRHGKGGYFDMPHVAVVGDRPEFITPEDSVGRLAEQIAGMINSSSGGGNSEDSMKLPDIYIEHTTVLGGEVIDRRIEKVGQKKINDGTWKIGVRNVKSRTS